jgi:diphthine-ammonia ligase
MQVFVSNMADFGVVNGAYKGFFGINPPPRACVGANLPKPCRIQVSCTAIRKGAIPTKSRQTLHVQGMSYWAPANIGPYSQATEVSTFCYVIKLQGLKYVAIDINIHFMVPCHFNSKRIIRLLLDKSV